MTTTHAAETLRRRMLSPWRFRGFCLTKLPLALVAGVRLTALDDDRAITTVPYGWRTRNPFRSTYFAALSMAAEMSTGALALHAVGSTPVAVATIIVGLEGRFTKKATATTTFTCEAGQALRDGAQRAASSGAPVIVEAETIGRSPDGVEVARFRFQWSFRRRA